MIFGPQPLKTYARQHQKIVRPLLVVSEEQLTDGVLKYSQDRTGYNQAYASCMEARGYTVR